MTGGAPIRATIACLLNCVSRGLYAGQATFGPIPKRPGIARESQDREIHDVGAV